MNIRIGLILLFMAWGPAAVAQFQPQPIGLDIGFTGGLNISTHTDKYLYSGDVAFTPRSATGYQLGLLVRRDLSDRLKIQAEPSVVKMGAQYQETFVQQELRYHTESRTRLVYLELPMTVQYSIDPVIESVIGRNPTYTRYHLTGGFFGGYLLDAQFKGMNYRSRSFESFREGHFSSDVMNRYSKYDAGLIFGAGFEYDRIIGLGARLQYTLLQSYNGEPMYKPKNLAFMFSVTYLIVNG